MCKSVANFDKTQRWCGWMSAALSTTGRLCANLGQTLWWLLLVLASPMVEGASLLPSLRFVETHCHPTMYGLRLLNKKIREEASKFIDDALALIKQQGCFVAGTLVHTREGLKPIEEIKVGDYVLSKPESGEGKLCYQPVTKTYEYENRELYYVAWSARKEGVEPPPKFGMSWSEAMENEETEKAYLAWLRSQPPLRPENDPYDYGCIAVTGGHPIWVNQLEFSRYEGELTFTPETEDIHGWMSVEDLYIKVRDSVPDGDVVPERELQRIYVELADGRAAIISTIHPVLQSEDPDIGVAFHDWWGWESVDECSGRTLCFGREGVRDHYTDPSIRPRNTHLWQIDTSAYDYSGYDTESDMSVVRRSAGNLSSGYLPMRRKVYNLEVANTHTYFVTRWGLWVHNTSGANLPLNPAGAWISAALSTI